MYQHLECILEDLEKRFKHEFKLPYETEILSNIQSLSWKEKIIVIQHILKFEWSIGGATTLASLQRANILTASDYILKQKQMNEKFIQFILNDLLEVEFSLLANLVKHFRSDHPNSIEIKSILKICFKRIIFALAANANIISVNYLDKLNSYLTDDFIEPVKLLHLQLFLEVSTNTITEAITQQSQWNIEFPNEPTTMESIMLSIIDNNKEKCLHYLFNTTIESTFGWKFYLYFLLIISKQLSMALCTRVRNLLKELFKRYLERQNQINLFILLITARQICKYSNNFEEYSDWYKQTIGEMQYQITVDQFKFVMKGLEEMLQYENDKEILEVHGNISISSPPFCYEIVLNYKQMCRSKVNLLENINQLSCGASTNSQKQIFVIDDSDDEIVL